MNKSVRTNVTSTWCPECFNQKAYKSPIVGDSRMFPSDPSGSLDVLFNLSPWCFHKNVSSFIFLLGGFL